MDICQSPVSVKRYEQVDLCGVMFRTARSERGLTTMNFGVKAMFHSVNLGRKIWHFGMILDLIEVIPFEGHRPLRMAKLRFLKDLDKEIPVMDVDKLRRVNDDLGSSSQPYVELRHLHVGNILFWPRSLTSAGHELVVIERGNQYL